MAIVGSRIESVMMAHSASRIGYKRLASIVLDVACSVKTNGGQVNGGGRRSGYVLGPCTVTFQPVRTVKYQTRRQDPICT